MRYTKASILVLLFGGALVHAQEISTFNAYAAGRKSGGLFRGRGPQLAASSIPRNSPKWPCRAIVSAM
jgi:hypothetical protein